MSLSQKIRFEVFKRDKFTCQYCGRSVPDVQLQVDHINPVSLGGDDNIINLITSCQECNIGKSNRKLDDDVVIKKQFSEMANKQEQINQRKMLIEWRQSLKEEDTEIKEDFNEYFEIVTGRRINIDCKFYKSDLKKLLNKHGFDMLCQAVDAGFKSYEKYENTGERILQKLGGIAYNLSKEKEIPRYTEAQHIFVAFVRYYEYGYVKKRLKERMIRNIALGLSAGMTRALHDRIMAEVNEEDYLNFVSPVCKQELYMIICHIKGLYHTGQTTNLLDDDIEMIDKYYMKYCEESKEES